MKKIKKAIYAAAAALLAFSLTACSATEVFDDLVEDTAAEAIQETPAPSTTVITGLKQIDDTIAIPQFSASLAGSVALAQGGTYELDGTAKSTDGGTVTYQWYRNNVDSNGGGTPIQGAENAVYTARAESVGSVFYYVVAANNHGETCNMTTSETFEVMTRKNGEWLSDEFGKKYVNEDGTYPTESWLVIDRDTYHFDSAGYATTGWLAVGNFYYFFDSDGKLVRNGTTPDGYQTNDDGRMIGAGTPELPPTTAEIAAAAQQAAAEAAEAEAIAAEQAAAEAAAQAEAEAWAAQQAEAEAAQQAEAEAAAQAEAEAAAAAEAEYAEEYVEENNDEG